MATYPLSQGEARGGQDDGDHARAGDHHGAVCISLPLRADVRGDCSGRSLPLFLRSSRPADGRRREELASGLKVINARGRIAEEKKKKKREKAETGRERRGGGRGIAAARENLLHVEGETKHIYFLLLPALPEGHKCGAVAKRARAEKTVRLAPTPCLALWFIFVAWPSRRAGTDRRTFNCRDWRERESMARPIPGRTELMSCMYVCTY